MSNLLRRSSGVYVARLVVPVRLRAVIGKREMIASTGCRDLALAKVVATTLLAGWRRRFFDLDRLALAHASMNHESVIKLAEGHPLLSAPGYLSLDQAAAASGIDQSGLLRYAADGRLRLFVRMAGEAGYLLPVSDVETDGETGARSIPPPHHMPLTAVRHEASGVLVLPADAVPPVAADLLADRGADIVALESGRPGVIFVPDKVMSLSRERIEVEALQVETLRRPLAAGITPGTLEAARALRLASVQGSAGKASKKGAKRLSEALDAYASQELPQTIHKRDEIKRQRDGIHLLIEFMGDVTLSQVDSDFLRGFRDEHLSRCLAHENRARLKFKTSSMQTSIAAVVNAGVAWSTMSVGERDQRMTWIARMFAWLHRNGWIGEDPAAPLRGVSVQTKAEKVAANREAPASRREPFTADELKAIFSLEWFSSGRGPLLKGSKIDRRFQPFQFWLPLLGLHTGARIAELSQLWLDDVRQTYAGTWFIDINRVTVDKSLKNDNSVREVPLHPVLIDAGFPEWCERLRDAGYRRVFPELAWNKRNQYAKEPIRAHVALFEGLGMPRDGTKAFHSLRHNFNTALERMNDVGEIARRRLLGHLAGSDVNAKHYTAERGPDETIAIVRLLNFGLPPVARFDMAAGLAAIRAALDRKHGERKGKEDMGPAGA